MKPRDIQEGRTYHNGRLKFRKVVLIGNRHKDDADLYYQPEGKDYWLAMSLVGFAKWAKGEGRESIPKEDTNDGI